MWLTFGAVLLATNFYVSFHIVSCTGTKTRGGRVVGGSDADITDYPHQAALLKDHDGHSDFKLQCGGTILNEKFVLTAASCFEDVINGTTTFQVRVGASNYEAATQTVPVLNYTKHPLYSGAYSTYDAAVLELATPLDLSSDSTKPAVLPDVGQTWSDGTGATLTGWGYVTQGGETSPILQQADFHILDESVCAFLYGDNLAESRICVGPTDFVYWTQDACLHDEGSPLVLNGTNTVVGFVSFTTCNRCPYVALYTDLANEDVRRFVTEVAGV